MIGFVLLSGYSIWLTKNKIQTWQISLQSKNILFSALQFLKLSPARHNLIQNLPSFCSLFYPRGLSAKQYLGTCDTGLCIIFSCCVMVKPSSHSCLSTKVMPGPLGIASARLRRKTSQFFSPVWLDETALRYFSARSCCFREGKTRGRD